MINPIWLKTFQTLVEVGHFTHTAEQLFMTQPGVSQHLRKLEEACGHPLIQREGKRFEITEQGQAVYRYALEQQAQEAELLASLSEDNPHQGICKLSCSGAVAMRIYAPLLAKQRRHPGLRIELEAAPNTRIMHQVREGLIDMGIVTRAPEEAHFKVERIGSETLCLVLPKAHTVDQPIAKTLGQLGLIEHPDAMQYLALYCSQCGDPELANLPLHELPRTGYINQLHQILLPVAQGLGFTALPYSAVESFADQDALAIHSPNHAVVEPLFLITKRHRELPSRFTAIKTLLQALLG